MTNRKQLKIGLFGFGTVGKGLFDVLMQTKGLKAEIKKICVKDPDKKRSVNQSLITYDKNDLLNDPDINVIVELIDDAHAAYDIVTTALKNGKAVVTANKKLVAEHLPELIMLQQKFDIPLLYEAACCASLPVIRNLEEYYDNDLLQSVQGIVNGCTNYILTKIFKEGISYSTALQQAQEMGYAESNPKLDIEGFDAKYKLVLLLLHAFGLKANPGEIWNMGIQQIGELESQYAREKGLKIKLIAQARKVNDKIYALVAPQLVSKNNRLFFTDNEYNGVIIESVFADKQFIEGKGAGAFPTASAVLSDLSALTYDYRYEYKKVKQKNDLHLSNAFTLEVLVRYADVNLLLENDFMEITEHYRSKNEHYLIGRIGFENLVNAKWIDKVSVVLTEKGIQTF